MSVLDSIAKISLESDKPGRMIIKGLDSQPIRAADGSVSYIDLYSADSVIAQKHRREIDRRRLVASRGGRGLKITPEELAGDAVDLLVTLTAGAGTIATDGTVTPDEDFKAEKFRAIYADPANAEFRGQVEDFVGERGNFAKASSTS